MRQLENDKLHPLADRFARLVDDDDPEFDLFRAAAEIAREPRAALYDTSRPDYVRTALANETKGFSISQKS